MVQKKLPDNRAYQRGYVNVLGQLKLAGIGIQLTLKGIKDPQAIVEQGKALVEKAKGVPEKVDVAISDEMLLEGLANLLHKKRP